MTLTNERTTTFIETKDVKLDNYFKGLAMLRNAFNASEKNTIGNQTVFAIQNHERKTFPVLKNKTFAIVEIDSLCVSIY